MATGLLCGLHPGTYVLILQLVQEKRIRIGRLGQFVLPRGYYAYVGSALGPGGLEKRLRHHLNPGPKFHWHLDYLRKEADPVKVWIREGGERREHDWASVLRAMKGVRIPVKGFGSSDCKCPAHLFLFQQRLSIRPFRAALRRTFGADPGLRVLSIQRGVRKTI